MTPPDSVENRILGIVTSAASELHHLAELGGLVNPTPEEVLRDQTWAFRKALLEDFPEQGHSIDEITFLTRIKRQAEILRRQNPSATYFRSNSFPFMDLEADDINQRYSIMFYDPRILELPLQGSFQQFRGEGIRINRSGLGLWVKTRSYPLPTKIDLRSDPKNENRPNQVAASQPERIRFITQFAYWATEIKDPKVNV